MYQRKTTIINRTGIHARPASVFVNEAKKFQSNITICNLSLNEQNNTANAKSIIKVLTLALSQGSEVEVSAEGVFYFILEGLLSSPFLFNSLLDVEHNTKFYDIFRSIVLL